MQHLTIVRGDISKVRRKYLAMNLIHYLGSKNSSNSEPWIEENVIFFCWWQAVISFSRKNIWKNVACPAYHCFPSIPSNGETTEQQWDTTVRRTKGGWVSRQPNSWDDRCCQQRAFRVFESSTANIKRRKKIKIFTLSEKSFGIMILCSFCILYINAICPQSISYFPCICIYTYVVACTNA